MVCTEWPTSAGGLLGGQGVSGTVECRRTGLMMVCVNRAEWVGGCNNEDWCAVGGRTGGCENSAD